MFCFVFKHNALVITSESVMESRKIHQKKTEAQLTLPHGSLISEIKI